MKSFVLYVSRPVFIDAETKKEAIEKFIAQRKNSLEEVLEVQEYEE